MTKKRAVIIGAGIGGLAAAIQLARKGFRVTVFEKNGAPGGRCGRITKRGHTFDTGPTMYLFPRIYEDFFASIGEDVNKHLTLLPADPRYKLHFADGTALTITSDPDAMKSQLESFAPGSYLGYLSYLNGGKDHYRIAMERMVRKNLTRPRDYFNLENLYLLLSHRALMPHYAYTGAYFRHPNLRAAFTFQDSYLSLNPFRAPAICSLFSWSEHTEGSFLPEGGMHGVIQALTRIAKKHGVKVFCNSPVRKIITDNGRATGVSLEDGSDSPTDCIIVNADMTYSYRNLLPPDPYAKSLARKKFSCSAVIFHWGTDETYPQLATHNLFFTDPYRRGFDDVLARAEPPEETHFYIQAPSRTDPSRAPENGDTLSVMIPINHIRNDHPVDWKQYAGHLRTKVLRRLADTGMRDLNRHITTEITFTPPDWEKRYNLTYGAIYGLDHGIRQLGYLRPKRRHRKYGNVYFTGADTHPGSGMPTVLLSSQFTAQAVLGE